MAESETGRLSQIQKRRAAGHHRDCPIRHVFKLLHSLGLSRFSLKALTAPGQIACTSACASDRSDLLVTLSESNAKVLYFKPSLPTNCGM